MYSIGAGSSLNPGSGLKVMAPVIKSTLQVPSPETTKSSPGFVVPTIWTVVGSTRSPVKSFARISTTTSVPGMFPGVLASSVAIGK